MGALLGAVGEGAAGAGEGAAATGATSAVASSVADAAAPAASDALSIAPLTDTGLAGTLGPSSAQLGGFSSGPGFWSQAGEFGKQFGLDIAKNLIQTSLQKIPGGSAIGSHLAANFDSPEIKNLFANPNDEMKKRDDLIDLLLRQRGVKTSG